MVDLKAEELGDIFPPVTKAGVSILLLQGEGLIEVAPYPEAGEAFARGFKRAFGAPWPEPGQSVTGKDCEVIWSAREQAFVLGGAAARRAQEAGLQALAAVADQSDGWVRIGVTGEAGAEVLARLCPLDLTRMETGAAARSLLGEVSVLIVRRAEGFEIFVYRSFVGHVMQELHHVLDLYAARQML